MSCSPTRLLNAGDEALAGHVAEADAADAELAVHRPRPPAQLAAALDPDLLAHRHLHRGAGLPAGLQLRQLLAELDVLRFGRHRVIPSGVRRPLQCSNGPRTKY